MALGYGAREVSHLLRLMAALLEIKGEESFKTRSYERAAESIEQGAYDLLEMAQEGKLQEIPGVGKNLEPKIKEMVLEGKSSFLEGLLKEIPKGLLELLRVPGIGPNTARLFHEQLGVNDLGDLEKAILDHRLAEVPGLGPKREELIKKGLIEVKKFLGRAILGDALPYAEALQYEIRERGISAFISGELRCGCETVSSIDLLLERAPFDVLEPIFTEFGLSPLEKSVRGERDNPLAGQALSWLSLRSPLDVPVRLLVLDEIQPFLDLPLILFITTGPREHLEWIKKRCDETGFDLTAKGLFKDGKKEPLKDESTLYECLGLSFIPPEVRHRPEFWRKAQAGEEIRLINLNDIKADLHLHTNWSDGTASIEDMAEKAAKLGYGYIAITDHASSMKLVNGLSPERLSCQGEEIDRVIRLGSIEMLKGVEVDIRRDGSLFIPDSTLSTLDFVIASIHDDPSDRRGNLEERLVSAAKMPYVHMIGHPTGRLIGRRGGYQGDFAPVFDAAKSYNTILEINSSPYRLDLNDDLVFLAIQKGVKLIVTTDAHGPNGMDDMRFGVISCLRRAGAKREDVLNTLSAIDFTRQLKALKKPFS